MYKNLFVTNIYIYCALQKNMAPNTVVIFLVLLVLAFIFVATSNTNINTAATQMLTSNCIDTDNQNYREKGTCIDSIGTYADHCDRDGSIREYYCQAQKCTEISFKDLPGVCVDGVWTYLPS